MKIPAARLLHLLCVLALLLPLTLAAQRKQGRRVSEVTIKRMDGHKLRGIPVAFTDSTVRILRKKPMIPGVFPLLGPFGTAVGRYRGAPDTVTLSVLEIKKINAGRRITKWVAIYIATQVLGVAGIFYGYNVGHRNKDIGISSGMLIGFLAGEAAGIPVGVGIGDWFRKKYVLHGSLAQYQKMKPDLMQHLPKD